MLEGDAKGICCFENHSMNVYFHKVANEDGVKITPNTDSEMMIAHVKGKAV